MGTFDKNPTKNPRQTKTLKHPEVTTTTKKKTKKKKQKNKIISSLKKKHNGEGIDQTH